MSVKSYPPPAGWSLTGQRIPHQPGFDWSCSRKRWLYGALRVQDGHALTLTAARRNTAGYLRLLDAVDHANPDGELYLIADNLASHKSVGAQLWCAEHPRVHPVYLPTKAAWRNLIEPWWRVLRRAALAGQTFEHGGEIEQAIAVATRQLNSRAKAWVWGRSPQQPRYRQRRLVYSL